MMKKKITLFVKGALLILSISVQAQDGLFISEVTDPLDDYSGRFIELYNAGAEAVDFSTYTFYLSRQSNGGTSWGDVQLIGTIAAGETFVIGGSSFETVYGFAPDQETGILIGNGDDAYVLFTDGDHTTGTVRDIYGVIDVDGSGEAWEYEDSRALRSESVTTPSAIWTAEEWEIATANIADCDPGTHYGSGGSDPIPGSYSLLLENDTVLIGQSVEVAILVSELTASDNVISYQFEIDYDPAVLEYTDTEIGGTMAENGSIVINSNFIGRLSISYMSSTPLIGEGTLASLQFNSLLTDTTSVTISNALLNTIQVNDLTNSIVIVKNTVPPTAIITYDDTSHRYADTLLITATFSEDMAPGNPVALSFSGAISLSDVNMLRQSERVYTYEFPIPKSEGVVVLLFSSGTDLWGNDVVPVPTEGDTFSIMEFRPGDVDDDSLILAYDAALTLQYSVGLDPLPIRDPLPWEDWRDSTANVDGTGGITANDAGLILQYSAGIISDFSDGNKKSLSFADITAEVIRDEIVLYSHGELIGFNLSTKNENNILSVPVTLGENCLFAKNIHEDIYNVGLCTARPLEEGSILMKIPINEPGSVTFKLKINTRDKNLTVDFSTGILDASKEKISVFPNPAKDIIHVSISDFDRIEVKKLRVVNMAGAVVYERKVEVSEIQISVCDLNGPGIYSVLLLREDEYVVSSKKFVAK